MLTHPQFDPIALSLGPLAIRWYGLSYLLAFVFAYLAGRWLIKRRLTPMTLRDAEDLIFYAVLGVVLGGRLGYVLFYKPGFYFEHPGKIFAVWEGGMSFHGGLLGVVAVIMLFAWRRGMTVRQVGDFAAVITPLGLMSGRIANFINGELWGRVTDSTLPWIMRFPQALNEDIFFAKLNPQWQQALTTFGGLPRHPSQIYQALGEGLLLFIIVAWYGSQPRRSGAVAAVFLIGYGLLRFAAEFTREPDVYLGLLAMNLSMGQWLCLPMIALGLYLFATAPKR